MTGNGSLAEQIKRDYRHAALDSKTRALLDYAVQVTREPLSVSQHTIDQLRALSWSDEDILTATPIVGFFNYYARLADALGVEPEEFMQRERYPR